MTIEWWLVRHGITEWNAARRYQGHSDLPLLAGEACGLTELRRELAGISFAAVYSSDLRRCRETLVFARPDLVSGAVLDPRLREMHFGAWEGQTYEMLKEDELYRSWLDDPQKAAPPGGESWQAFRERVTEMFEVLKTRSQSLAAAKGLSLQEGAQTPSEDARTLGEESPTLGARSQAVCLLVVTHGGVISMISSLLQPGLDFWETRVGPGGVKRLML